MNSTQSPAVIHATTAEGLPLAVIDLTHPDFAVPDDAKSLEALQARALQEQRERRVVPRFLMRALTWFAVQRSPLLRAVLASDAAFLDSITTYMMKLGERHLPPGFDGPIDRKVAASPQVTLVRLRMQQIATFCAHALAEPLRASATAPLHLVNIAGGPALDSINTLLFLRRDHASLLRRPIVIHVLDANKPGPAFGANVLAALKADGAPLNGLDVTFDYQTYDWGQTQPLQKLLTDLTARGAIIAASTEGGLFEYGDDAAIIGNLSVLSAAKIDIVAGSVTSSSEFRKQTIAETRFELHPRGLEGFEPLARKGGYVIAEVEPALLSEQVLLRLAS